MEFLESLGAETSVIIVDNSVEDDDLGDLAHRFDNVRHVDAGGNVGFSVGANIGARHSSAKYIVFMNPDTLPRSAELERMVDALEADESVASCGAVGIGTAGGGAQPTLQRTLAHSLGLHRMFPLIGIYFYPRDGDRIPVGWVSGSCLAVRRADFDSVDGFDESYFVFMSDFDLGRKFVAADRSQLLLGDVTVRHIDGGSSDIPSEWTWDQRGKGWAQYLRRTQPRWSGLAVASALVIGYLGRTFIYTAIRRTTKAKEVRTLAKSLTAEWKRLR